MFQLMRFVAGDASRSGSRYTVRNEAWNGSLAAGGSTTFGFTATPGGSGGANYAPVSPTGNGAAGTFWDKNRTGDVVVDELTPLAEPERHIK